MKKIFFTIFLFATTIASFAQDYKVQSVEYLPGVLTAQINPKTERPNSGQKCAVLQIVTQNISVEDRSSFKFTPDMASYIPEKKFEKSKWLLWVSPGITYLIIDSNLGPLEIYFPEYLQDEIESLKTYQITIEGTRPLPAPEKNYFGSGSGSITFIPTPADAIIYIGEDSIGSGNRTFKGVSGTTYNWSMKHPLYHTESGIIKLSKGKNDTINIALSPAYGYMKILEDYGMDESEELSVYLNGTHKGYVPYESEKLAPGQYEVTLKADDDDDSIISVSQIEVKEQMVSVNRADELRWNYEKALNIDQQLSSIDSINGLGENDENSSNSYGMASDSLFTFKAKPTRYYPIMGKVTITSTPEASVTIDSVLYGLTPINIDSLPVGKHQIKLSAKSYKTLIQEIGVEEEAEMSYSYQLDHLCITTIITDQEGDKVYVNKVPVGKTPVTFERPFGTYSITIIRPTQAIQQEQEITLSPDDFEPTFNFPFGQTVNVETRKHKSKLYLDEKYMGRAPMSLYLTNGKHQIRAEHGWKEGKRTITISNDKPVDNLNIGTHMLSMSSFLSKGAFFLTGNLGFFNKGGESVYGFNIGDIGNGGQAGWYFSIMTNSKFVNQLCNKDYSVLNAYLKADENGEVYASHETYSGERSFIRASALFGVALKVAGPVYLRFAGGYGIRRDAWKTTNDKWVIIDPHSWQDFEGSLGLQCCFYNIVVNGDVLIPVREVLTNEKSLIEYRVGLGFCLKHKK